MAMQHPVADPVGGDFYVPRLRHAFEIPLLVLAAAGILRLVDARRAT